MDLLPCQFPKSETAINRDVFFDPCIKQSEQQESLEKVSLQGRQIVGRTYDLHDAGMQGLVLGKYSEEVDSVVKQVQFQ